MSENNPNWDIQLKRGQQTEASFARILHCETFEVKDDDVAQRTGKIAIEYSCNGKPSGIAVSKADMWAYLYARGCWLLFEKAEFRQIFEHFNALSGECFHKTGCGDGGRTRLVTVPLRELMAFTRSFQR